MTTYWLNIISFYFVFKGTLLSVSPSFLSRINGLFHINERVLYVGEWIYGFFSLTAIGATNVGSIKAYFDKVKLTGIKKQMNNFIILLFKTEFTNKQIICQKI